MFNDQRRKNASFVFEKMKRYYPNFETPDEFAIGEWVGILDGYSQTDILEALKNYRKNVPYNVAPTPAAFKAFLHPSEVATPTITEQSKGDFAWERMNADIESGNCCNNLYVYRDAERIMLNEWLVEYFPIDVVRKMGYASKLQKAQENGLVDKFDEALRQAAQKRFGRDFEYNSKNVIENAKVNTRFDLQKTAQSMAAHWRV